MAETPSEEVVAVEYVPTSAVVDEWFITSYVKIWMDARVRIGTDDHKRGTTQIPPFGMEWRIAHPLTDNPKTPPPEGCITLEQFRDRVLKPSIDMNRWALNYSAGISEDF